MPAKRLIVAALLLAVSSCAALTQDYKDKVEKWRVGNSKEEFLNRASDDIVKGGAKKLDKLQKERLWAHFQMLLDHGGVRFKSDTSIIYSTPITFAFSYITRFLPDVLLDGAEMISREGHKLYYGALHIFGESAHEVYHDAVWWMNESGAIYIPLTLCGGYLAIAFLSWMINRFTDGIWPSERRLAKEVRERSTEYLKSKRL